MVCISELALKSIFRVPAWLLIPAAAVFAAIALMAALHLVTLDSRSQTQRDPLTPDALAADESGEIVRKRFSSPNMQLLEDRAAEQFGRLPAAPSTEITQLASDDAGTRALDDLERIRHIRRSQGSAAAVAALKQSASIPAR
jgi:hypothetical protein